MAASTAPAVKAKLVALFTAAVGAETQVWFNRPNEEHQFDENIYVGAIRGDHQWAGLGKHRPNQVEETYAIAVEVEVYRDGTDAEGTENRLWEIVALLEAAVNDPTLGNMDNVTWSLFERFIQESRGTTNGWLAAAKLDFAVTARI